MTPKVKAKKRYFVSGSLPERRRSPRVNSVFALVMRYDSAFFIFKLLLFSSINSRIWSAWSSSRIHCS